MLIHIDPKYLDAVWPHVEALLASSVDKAHGEMSVDQLKLLIRQGRTELFVWQEGDAIQTVGAVDIVDFPNYRVANVTYLGGKYTEASFEAMKRWLSGLGASQLQCWCNDAAARLYERYGLKRAYHVMRCEL